MTGSNETPTLVVGLDGATFDIIDPMIKQGKLPNIKRLMDMGSRAKLASSSPPLSAIAWTTITTGVNPGKHGIYDFAHRARKSYEFIPYTAKDKRAPSLWGHLSENGKSVCVVNVPLTYPPEEVNGVMLSGFPSPPNSMDWTYPQSLAEDLKREFGDDDFQKPVSLVPEGEEGALLDALETTTRNQMRVIAYLMKQRRY
ncbi:MAG: alkaline phosphatase family protein, partial [Thaumarchaeota archaeon]|nr:alkaline phosphatase family protein [Nitrososphaerota archaeon]